MVKLRLPLQKEIWGLKYFQAAELGISKDINDIILIIMCDVIKVKVDQSCLTLCHPMDYTVLGILQARILEWVAFPFSRGIFPTQGLNPGLLHCRQILYQLSYKESPCDVIRSV